MKYVRYEEKKLFKNSLKKRLNENYNKYIKDHSSTPKVNIDLVKKVNTEEEIITCN